MHYSPIGAFAASCAVDTSWLQEKGILDKLGQDDDDHAGEEAGLQQDGLHPVRHVEQEPGLRPAMDCGQLG